MLKRGTDEQRKLSWTTNFLVANNLADEVKKKQIHLNVNPDTKWYPLSRVLDEEKKSHNTHIFSPWKSISRKIKAMSSH